MSSAAIHAVLRRRAIADDRLGLGLGGRDDDDDAYWASPPRLYDFSKHQLLKDEPPVRDHHPLPSPPSPKPEPPPPAPPSPAPVPPSPTDAHLCLLALQGTGVSWGVRKRVRFVHRAARRAHNNAALPLMTPAPAAQSAPAAVAARQADEESSSNVKPTDPKPEEESVQDGRDEEEAVKTGEEKKKRRRRKNGSTLWRPRKRAHRERKPPAPKAERVVAAAPRAVADRSVAQVYAATEAAESKREVEREVACRSRAAGARKRKEGALTRAAVAKRPRKVVPKKEEEGEESGDVERKPVVRVKTERKKSRRDEEEEEESGRYERKAAVVVKTERKQSRREEDEEESGQDDRKALVIINAERKSSRRKSTNTKTVTKPAPENKLAVKVEEPGGAPRAMVDRWAAKRYAAAEASLLAVLRSLRARAGKPVQRRQLREEARKRIGDTGLLDHLLKHTKDKVTPCGAERLRRRHNADGAMEYWLEPAGFVALRREAGVADPYWVPPSGWKLGDPVSPDACALEMKRKMEELATELAGVKRHMQQLLKARPGTLSNEVKSEAVKAYISDEPYQEKYGCMVKANGNLEKQVLSLEEKYADAAQANDKLEEEVLLLKEKYEAVVEKNTRLEEQMTALSTSFLSLKDDVLFLNDGEQPLQLMEPEQVQLRLCAKESPDAEKQESNGGSLESPDEAAAALADIAGSGGGGKRTSRKCSVRICKPQGAFQWPDAAPPSSPVTPEVAGMGDDDEGHAMAELPPTPPSASSTNASSPAKLAPGSPPPTCSVDIQAPRSGPGLHAAQDALPLPCGATVGLPEGTNTTTTLALYAGRGGGVGTELALATPSY